MRRPRRLGESVGLAWDLAIIGLVVANLTLIVFDTLFAAPPFAALVNWLSPTFHDWYRTAVHANFLAIDLAFVSVFAFDVLLGWAVAIAERRYHRWFFYPIVRWYDVLGCIPLAGFRWLRVLRIIALGMRLQRMGLIDVQRWRVFETGRKYYEIVLEELSDRVVAKVLEGVQEEIREGEHLPRLILREVVAPRRRELVDGIAGRLEHTADKTYARNREALNGYLEGLVTRAVAENGNVRAVERIPMLGSYATQMLERAISDVVCRVVEEAVTGLRSSEFQGLLHGVTDSAFDAWLEEEPSADETTQAIMLEILEVLKEQVLVQRWKQQYA